MMLGFLLTRANSKFSRKFKVCSARQGIVFLKFLLCFYIYSAASVSVTPPGSRTGNIGRNSLDSLDSDGNGVLSSDEVGMSDFFRGVDSDGDGKIELDEVTNFVKDLGGASFDDEKEIRNGVRAAFANIDNGNDGVIHSSDLLKHWNMHSMANLVTVGDVCSWVEHAVQLPSVSGLFREHAITGFDLPLLVENNGEYLKTMGISDKLIRNKLLRAIKARLLGVSSVPASPLFLCMVHGQEVRMSWTMKESNHDVNDAVTHKPLPVHKWRLLRRDSSWDEWVLVKEFGASQLRFVDKSNALAKSGGRCKSNGVCDFGEYRVEAWNMVGNSFTEAVAKPEDLGDKEKESKHSEQSETGTGLKKDEKTILQDAFAENFADDMFRDVDADGDGDLEAPELRGFIKDFGGKDFDEEKEISGAVDAMFGVIDTNNDKILKRQDLLDHWNKVGSELSVEDVAQWIEHAIQLPQYVQRFKENAVRGYDLPGLLGNGGQGLKRDLGITNALHRNKIIRGIRIRFLAMASKPMSPVLVCTKLSPPQCGALQLQWLFEESEGSSVKVHKFQVQRRPMEPGGGVSRSPQGFAKKSQESEGPVWETVYEGLGDSFVDTGLEPGTTYEYRIQAWNLVGASKLHTLSRAQECYAGRAGCNQGLLSWFFFILWLPIRVLVFLADNHYRIIGIVTLFGAALSWGRLAKSTRQRMMMYFRSSFMPRLFDAYLGGSDGGATLNTNELGAIDAYAGPETPTSKVIREAAEFAFRGRASRKTNILSDSDSASSHSFADAQTSSPEHDENKSKRVSKWAIVRRKLLRNRFKHKHKNKVPKPNASVHSSPDSRNSKISSRYGSLQKSQELSPSVNIKYCMICKSNVTGIHKWRRHHCRHCQGIFCDKHTAYHPHNALLPCGVNSKCICVGCFKKKKSS